MKIKDYEGSDPELTQRDYQFALDSQSACNLPGISNSFIEVFTRIRLAGRRRGEGSEWPNQHPVCILFATQIIFLVRGNVECREDDNSVSYREAYDYCLDRARADYEQDPQAE